MRKCDKDLVLTIARRIRLDYSGNRYTDRVLDRVVKELESVPELADESEDDLK